MTRLESYEQFHEAYTEARRTAGKLTSNCVFLRKTLEEHLSAGTASMERSAHGIVVLLEDHVPGYSKLIYCLDSPESLTAPAHTGHVLVEETGRDGDRRSEEIDRIFLSKGYSRIARNYQVFCSIGPGRKNRSAVAGLLSSEGYRLEISFSGKQKDEITALWKLYLKPTDVPSSHYRDLESDDGSIICAVNAADEVCGVIWWSVSGKTCEMRHVVTRPSDRKHGIAQNLEEYVVSLAAEAGCSSVFTFIDRCNEPSFRVSEKAGFSRTDKFSTQYCL